ncbi:hypothetical protein [Phenylobacterium sp.]|uniref:hypothetical protein n=1 Tax=Phenylobacterium sp. TaxID=1871053 RepID=UPI002725B467|nr:hypothetical protein [Phenylobacterium sp.]MDO8801291.1 hypothetical protein [Phenylobacterium sp.]
MSKARRWRSGALVAGSVVAHLGVLAILTATRPQPRLYEPPEVFEVTVAPRVITTPQEVTRPRELLRPRPSRSRPDDLSVAPLVVPQAQAPALPAPTPPSLTPQLSAALRRGLGCANIAALSPDERDRCLERLGAGAGDLAPLPLGTPAGKQKGFDTAAAHKEACRKYREGMPPGLSAPSAVGMPAGLGSGPALRGGTC